MGLAGIPFPGVSLCTVFLALFLLAMFTAWVWVSCNRLEVLRFTLFFGGLNTVMTEVVEVSERAFLMIAGTLWMH